MLKIQVVEFWKLGRQQFVGISGIGFQRPEVPLE